MVNKIFYIIYIYMADEDDEFFFKGEKVGSLACAKKTVEIIEDSSRKYRDATIASDLFGGIVASEIHKQWQMG